MDEKQLQQVKQLIEQMENDDKRLTEHQKGMMRQMIAGGMDEHEAKLRVLCIGKSPEHMEVIPADPNVHFPCAVYRKTGEIKTAANEEDFKAAIAAGWEDKPSAIHVKKTLEDAQMRHKALQPKRFEEVHV